MVHGQRPAEDRYEGSMIPKTPSHFARPWLTGGFSGRSGKKPEGFPAGAIRPCESTGKAFWNAGGAWIC